MTLPPDPYALKIVETATKTAIELLHEDVKAGLKELINITKERGKEQAIKNADAFDKALESDMSERLSVPLLPNGYERIVGNLNDPDFAYIVRQATIASARTSNQDKHKLLARAVTERLFAQPEGLVALASSWACEIIPNLTPLQLSFLGLLTTVRNIRQTYNPETLQAPSEIQQSLYLSWLENELTAFYPYPKMRQIDYDHLKGMSCVTGEYSSRMNLEGILTPKGLPKFTWPKEHSRKNNLILELKQIDGIWWCHTTTVGAIIGVHVHDIRQNKKPTTITWDDSD